MKRYKKSLRFGLGTVQAMMELDEKGDWVLFDDAIADRKQGVYAILGRNLNEICKQIEILQEFIKKARMSLIRASGEYECYGIGRGRHEFDALINEAENILKEIDGKLDAIEKLEGEKS